jgi:hypothetical protein
LLDASLEARSRLCPGVQLPIARYCFIFRVQDDLRLPEYAGSLLRGQFGASLRGIACMTGLQECKPCPLYRTCPYPAIFETPAPPEHVLQRFNQVPNPYVIEPPPLGFRHIDAGERASFHIVLVGRALTQLPLITYAFERAFERGLGRSRVRGRLDDIVLERPHSSSGLGETRRNYSLCFESDFIDRAPKVIAGVEKFFYVQRSAIPCKVNVEASRIIYVAYNDIYNKSNLTVFQQVYNRGGASGWTFEQLNSATAVRSDQMQVLNLSANFGLEESEAFKAVKTFGIPGIPRT